MRSSKVVPEQPPVDPEPPLLFSLIFFALFFSFFFFFLSFLLFLSFFLSLSLLEDELGLLLLFLSLSLSMYLSLSLSPSPSLHKKPATMRPQCSRGDDGGRGQERLGVTCLHPCSCLA